MEDRKLNKKEIATQETNKALIKRESELLNSIFVND